MNGLYVITVCRPQRRPKYFLKTWERLIDSWFKTVEGQQSRVLQADRARQDRGGRKATEGSSWPSSRTEEQEGGHRLVACQHCQPATIISHRRRTQSKGTAPRGMGLTGRRRSRSDSRALASRNRLKHEGGRKGGKGNSFGETSKL